MTKELALPQLGTVQLISNARRALAEARSLPDVQRVMAIAQTVADAGRRAAKLAEAQGMAAEIVDAANDAANDAAAVRIEAQAKAGEMLHEMQDRGERVSDHGGHQFALLDATRTDQPATLGELGVEKTAAHRWQKVADVPEGVRQGYVEETKTAKGEVTTAGLLRFAAARQVDEAPAEPDTSTELARAYGAVVDAMTVLAQYRNAGAIAAYAGDSRRKARFRGLVARTRAWVTEAEATLG